MCRVALGSLSEGASICLAEGLSALRFGHYKSFAPKLNIILAPRAQDLQTFGSRSVTFHLQAALKACMEVHLCNCAHCHHRVRLVFLGKAQTLALF
jgi:hypothetical protein